MKMNRRLAILFFTMVVVMLGFGIVIPILPFYVGYYSGWPHFSTTKARRHKENLVKHYPALAHNPRNLVTWCLCG